MLFLPASLEMFGIRYEHSTVISLIPAILMSLFILSKVSTLKKFCRNTILCRKNREINFHKNKIGEKMQFGGNQNAIQLL